MRYFEKKDLEKKTFGRGARFGYEFRKGWELSYRMGQTARGDWVICELTIKRKWRSLTDSVEPPGGITTLLLRKVRLGEDRRYGSATIETQDPAGIKPQQTTPGRHRGRPLVISVKKYQRIAMRDRALRLAKAPHPAKTLAEEFGYKRPAMRSLLRRIRDKVNRGLLPKL